MPEAQQYEQLPRPLGPRAWALAALMLAALSALWWWGETALVHLGAACHQLIDWHQMAPVAATAAFVLCFAAMSALAIPGCSVLALAAGAAFGPWWATLLITLSSAAGATASFLAARLWWREHARRRWQGWMHRVEPLIERDGALGLFTLRMAPVIPFPVLNPLMGLTRMPAWTFFWVSALGMAAGSAAYAVAGAGLGGLATAGSAPPIGLMLAALALLSLLPWGARWAWRRVRA
jgi:uncharacterized membrane protein YdjX (TVP38/TMEM64 family)